MKTPASISGYMIFPDGTRIPTANVYSVTTGVNTITVVYTGGNYTYTCQTGMFLYVLNQIDNAISGSGGLIEIQPAPFYLTSISPTTFDAAGGATITINGVGFNSSTIGLLHLEDTETFQDDNGYSWTCTFVSDTQLTAVFNSSGDGVLSGADEVVDIYYKDSNGLKSNCLKGLNLSGTIINL